MTVGPDTDDALESSLADHMREYFFCVKSSGEGRVSKEDRRIQHCRSTGEPHQCTGAQACCSASCQAPQHVCCASSLQETAAPLNQQIQEVTDTNV